MLLFGFSKLVASLSGLVSTTDERWREFAEEQIADLKTSIQTGKGHYDDESLANMQSQLETYELALKYDVGYMYGDNTWKGNLLYEIQDLKREVILAENRNAENTEKNKDISDKIKLIENNDFAGYIKLRKDAAKKEFDSKKIGEEEYNEKIYLLGLEEKYEIYKENNEENQGKQSIYRDICSIKNNLRTGIDSLTGKLMNEKEIKDLEDKLKINEYRLEKNIPSVDSSLVRKKCV